MSLTWERITQGQDYRGQGDEVRVIGVRVRVIATDQTVFRVIARVIVGVRVRGRGRARSQG